jgi:hypothetical protein
VPTRAFAGFEAVTEPRGRLLKPNLLNLSYEVAAKVAPMFTLPLAGGQRSRRTRSECRTDPGQEASGGSSLKAIPPAGYQGLGRDLERGGQADRLADGPPAERVGQLHERCSNVRSSTVVTFCRGRRNGACERQDHDHHRQPPPDGRTRRMSLSEAEVHVGFPIGMQVRGATSRLRVGADY